MSGGMVLALVATASGQGQRRSDFFNANEGELVCFPFECDGESVDGGCGCRRSMVGMTSKKATTTMTVASFPVGMVQNALRLHIVASWGGTMTTREIEDWVKTQYMDITRVARVMGVGTIVERRGQTLQEREIKSVKK